MAKSNIQSDEYVEKMSKGLDIPFSEEEMDERREFYAKKGIRVFKK